MISLHKQKDSRIVMFYVKNNKQDFVLKVCLQYNQILLSVSDPSLKFYQNVEGVHLIVSDLFPLTFACKFINQV